MSEGKGSTLWRWIWVPVVAPFLVLVLKEGYDRLTANRSQAGPSPAAPLNVAPVRSAPDAAAVVTAKPKPVVEDKPPVVIDD